MGAYEDHYVLGELEERAKDKCRAKCAAKWKKNGGCFLFVATVEVYLAGSLAERRLCCLIAESPTEKLN